MTNHLPTKTQNTFNVLWFTQFSLTLKRCCFVWLSLFSNSKSNNSKTRSVTFQSLTLKGLFVVILSNFYLVSAQAILFTENFNTNAWTFVNTGQTNTWRIGKPISEETLALYVSNGTNNNYTNKTSVVHAYRDIAIPAGVSHVSVYYDWLSNGEANDYFRVWLVSDTFNPTAGEPITAGADRILFKDKQYGKNSWTVEYNDAVDVSSFTGKNMRLLFEWTNNDAINNNRAASIDNITIVRSCIGTPVPGTATISPATGAPSSNFNVSTNTNYTTPGLSYQWQVSSDNINFIDISGVNTANATLKAVPFASTVRYYRRKITCISGGASAYTNSVKFTTNSTSYCTPTTSSKDNLYISSFKFVGTLNDPPLSANVSVGDGYKDYTDAYTPIAEQPDGSVINIEAIAKGSVNNGNGGNWKAWVDWNGDGDFNDSGEEVYKLTEFTTSALTFGFIIPPGQTPGKYRLRIKVRYNNSKSDFSACDTFPSGETEDYSFLVKYNCPATVNAVNIIPADGHRCGEGTVNLSASGTGTNYKWYSALTGGTALFTGSNYTTPSLSTTTVYYVTAINGSCESAYRIPVTARIDPKAEVSFSPAPSICGTATSGFQITGSGDKYVDTIIDEKFSAAAPSTGLFTAAIGGTFTNSDGSWKNRPSPFIPPVPTYAGLAPALSSGYFGGNYAAIVTDISRDQPILNSLTLTKGESLVNFQNLTLDFDLYYFSITTDPLKGNLKIEYSLNNGGDWTTLETITSIQGNPNVWAKKTYSIPGPYTSTQFKIRFLLFSFGGPSGTNSWQESIAAVDNVKVYGTKPITSGFEWSGPTSMLFEADCNKPLGATTKASTICIKPTATQLENDVSWTLTATAAFSSGCNASNSITINNDTKTWNNASGNWSNSTWKPGSGGLPPDASKCVIIKQPVSLISGNGLAKNITIEPGGSLTINKDQTLTVTDYIKNNTTLNNANNLVVESDGNLIQINSGAANIGSMTAKREVKDLRYQPGTAVDYVYWSSPVAGQKTKGIDGFAPGTPNGNFFYYRESNDRFYETGDPTFTPGRGYAVRAEGNITPTYTKTYEFKGTPNNGDISFPITRSADNPTGVVHGYNLVGNPYPSNINFEKLYTANSSLIYNTAWFWTNSVYIPTQQGSTYNGNNYAVLNGTGGAPATLTFNVKYSDKIPTGIINVGQAFLVQKKDVVPGSLNFKNTYGSGQQLRVSTGGTFYSRGTESKNRFWLKLQSPDELINSQLIGYIQGATNEFEIDYDAEAFSLSSNLFYSLLGDKKLLIQGKSDTFTVEDRVQLGANFFQTGTYTIALDNAEGIFKAGQAIYLRDKQTGNTANLSEGNYTFQAAKGETNGRFEIVYKPEIVLVTDHQSKNGLLVYRDSDNFVVQSQTKKITAIEVYEASGKLVYSLTPNSLKTVIPADKLLNNIYVLKINQGGVITTKKIIK